MLIKVDDGYVSDGQITHVEHIKNRGKGKSNVYLVNFANQLVVQTFRFDPIENIPANPGFELLFAQFDQDGFWYDRKPVCVWRMEGVHLSPMLAADDGAELDAMRTDLLWPDGRVHSYSECIWPSIDAWAKTRELELRKGWEQKRGTYIPRKKALDLCSKVEDTLLHQRNSLVSDLRFEDLSKEVKDRVSNRINDLDRVYSDIKEILKDDSIQHSSVT